MYSFRQRGDTTVVDEPLYAHYLSVTGIWHPDREEILKSLSNDGAAVVRDEILGPSPTPIIFFKQMAHHLVGLDWSFLDAVTNVILTRDPRAVLASFTKNVENVNADTTGLPLCLRLLDRILDADEKPVVIDARALLMNPPSVLTQVCGAIAIPWDPAMLSWEPGPVPEDGIWAKHWYANTHASTGFNAYVPRPIDLPPHLERIADECSPMYERLLTYAIRPDSP